MEGELAKGRAAPRGERPGHCFRARERRQRARRPFSPAQADRGAGLFEDVCGACHQPEDFTETFLESWAGQSVGALFGEIRETMPEDSPGSLRSSEYAAVIAYLFRLNGLPEGEEDLPAARRGMDTILIELPQAEGGDSP